MNKKDKTLKHGGLEIIFTRDTHYPESYADTIEGKKTFWHTASHILAQAVKRLYPQAKLAIGPSIDTGFYYDFEFDFDFSYLFC